MTCRHCDRLEPADFDGSLLADPLGLDLCHGGGECVTWRLKREAAMVVAAREVQTAAAGERLAVPLHNAVRDLLAAVEGHTPRTNPAPT